MTQMAQNYAGRMQEHRQAGSPPTPLWIDVVVALMRIAPGAIPGAAIGFHQVARWAIMEPTYFAAVILVPALLLGWLSARFGVAFWESSRDFMYWPRKF